MTATPHPVERPNRLVAWLTLAALVLVFGACTCGDALAHDVPPSLVLIDVEPHALAFELQLPLGELGAAMALPLAEQPDTAVGTFAPRIAEYVVANLHVRTRVGAPYALHVDAFERKTTANARWTGNDWIVVRVTARPPAGVSTAVFSLDYRPILQRVVSHEALIALRRDFRNGLYGDAPKPLATAAHGASRVEVDGSGGSVWRGVGGMIALGARHIAAGPDHLLFLVVLLLPAPLVATAGRWSPRRSLRATFGEIVRVVSGFTIGHAISLTAATAGWVDVPARAVEVGIALSIGVSCAHAWRPLFAGREAWIAAAFGLLHGLAFAETLAGLGLDGASLAWSLVGFNLGIEAMQLAVVAIALPPLLLATGSTHERPMRGAIVALAALVAAAWAVERALGLDDPMDGIARRLASPPLWVPLVACAASALAVVLLVRGRSRANAPRPAVSGSAS